MKALHWTFALALLAAVTAAASANTVSGKISATVTIVSGSKVSASISTAESTAAATSATPQPALTIGFDDVPRAWHLVKRVTWDKTTHHLTVDF